MDFSGKGFEHLLKTFVSLGYLDDVPLGIAKQVLAQDRESWRDKQAWMLEYEVMREYAQQRCERCGHALQWEEMPGVSDNNGCCGNCYCQ